MKCAWLAAAALALALAGCGKNLGPEDAARQFVEQITHGQANQAYESAAFGFQSAQAASFFATALREAGLDAVASVKYEKANLSSDGEVARVAVEFTTKSKAIVPLVIALNREDGAWKVLSLKSPRNPSTGQVENRFTLIGREPDFGDPTAQHRLPDLPTANTLAFDSLTLFNDAVKRKDFLNIFDEASLHWQDQLVSRQGPAAIPGTMKRALTLAERQLGAGRLQHAFQSFIDQNIDISGIKGIEPVFEPAPWVNTNGLLVLTGYYPTKPYRVLFNLRYRYEVPAWRLFGIDVSVKKPE